MTGEADSELINEPLRIATEGAAVVLYGPGTVALALTAEAAERSAALLMQGAQVARGAAQAD